MAQLRAAVEAGADAVYFGLEGFNARAKAMSFTRETLPDVMAELHERGVMGFVAVNTLAFDTELPRLEDEIAGIALAGADAIIVQDVGVMRLARLVAPDLAVHASTQMTVTSAEGAEFARSLGASRVVLARELSLREIEAIRATTSVELEVFVHGALCVSYSGQCFSSEAWGGRSANRGQCAQACRLPYELMVDGVYRDLGPYRYLLSPQDLYALEQVPQLMRIGVHCLKIEGRYKDAKYVAATTAAYRDAIDKAWDGGLSAVSDEQQLALEGVYSRGLLPAFMQGTNHQAVVVGRAPRHRGVKVGVVSLVHERSVRVRLEPGFLSRGGVVKPGDGLVFDGADWKSPQQPEEGGQVFEVFARGHRLEDSGEHHEVELRFGNKQVDFARVRVGDGVWRSHDPALEKKYRMYTRAITPVTRKPLSWTVLGRAGEHLKLVVRDESGREIEAVSDTLLQPAARRALDTQVLEAELSKLGDTPFFLAALENKLEGELFLPLSVLSRVRRAALDDLLAWRREPEQREIHTGQLETLRLGTPHLQTLDTTGSPLEPESSSTPEISVLVRRPDQLEAAIESRPDEIVLDYLELYGLRPSVERILEAGIRAVVASPRILKPAEERIHHFLLGLPAAILVRSIGLLKTLTATKDHPVLHGDFSLNAANGLTARALLQMGLSKLVPTHDLNAVQIAQLAERVDPNRLEVIAYHHLPVFHTEHCVFCRFLSSGTDYTNCGHPCETHNITLRDERGLEHPVLADVGCRNTVFEARAQSGARFLESWRAAGIRRFRLEFVHEDGAAVQGVIRAFRRFFEGKLNAAGLEHEWAKYARSGTTQGSFIVREALEGLEPLPMV
jgi:putative protease